MSDLDEFFAKKDKSKKKKGNKSVMAPQSLIDVSNAVAPEVEVGDTTGQDEWKDFEERKVDFTNLRIVDLGAVPEPKDEENKDADADAEDKPVIQKAKGETSWNIPQPGAAPKLAAPEPEKPTGRYVPGMMSARKDKAVVLGELSFPSLAEATSKTYAKDTEGFQEVKAKPSAKAPEASQPTPGKYVPPGARYVPPNQRGGSNKFEALGRY